MIKSMERDARTPVYDFASHDLFVKACMTALKPAVKRVQVLKRGIVYCATIRESLHLPNRPACWVVDADLPEVCKFAVTVERTRSCGGPTCMCEQADTNGAAACGDRVGAVGSHTLGVTCL